ncbi:hypothetical protein D7V94_08355 [Parablautia intestinalis]|uniref:Uncharacterized protein n=1 Tax=Parablautia intestinalis TaxID=2320100 RepID=A0A3A9AKF4_9FIRM|nr:hypothetical protein [Parablautia intestinalis]RKI92070.1 hypothetical protein D7V94_08355 [Parablautia intestinalis]
MNVQGKINNLLKALRQQGIVYKINTQQFYSESQGQLCTKLILWEEHPNRDGEVFFSKVKLLKYLAEKWKEVNGHGRAADGENEGTEAANERKAGGIL